MILIKDSFDFQEYMADLDSQGIVGVQFSFNHKNEPDHYPCVVETLIDTDGPGIDMVHVFFTEYDAALLSGLTVDSKE